MVLASLLLVASLPLVIAETANSSLVPYYTDPATYAALFQTSSSIDCYFGSFPCPGGGTACISPLGFAECVFDTVTTINLDTILPSFFDMVKDFSDDPVSFAVDIANETVKAAVKDLVECGKVLSGEPPSCSKLDSFKSCVNTASNTVSIAKIGAKGLSAKAMKRIDDGLDKVKEVTNNVNDQCKTGCNTGVCSSASLEYKEPVGCKCQSLTLAAKDQYHFSVTPSDCATNAAVFARDENGDKTFEGKVRFKYMGCYVGTEDKPFEWYNCSAAYESSAFQGAFFVRCVDQFGKVRELNATKNAQGGPNAALGAIMVVPILAMATFY